MNPKSYPLDLFLLLHRKKSSQKRDDDNNLNSAIGVVTATFISIALWSLIFSIGLILF